MKTRTRSLVCATGIAAVVSLSSLSSDAQGPPAMHWGGMDLQTSVANCLGRAKKAFSDAGVRNTQRSGWQTYGEKGPANVLVACAARTDKTSYLVVVAASNDSKAAELLRNDIRARIAAMREFD